MRLYPPLSAVLLVGLLAACGQTSRVAPPTLTLSAVDCPTAPNLALAKPLVLNGKDSTEYTVEVTVGGPCLRDAAGRGQLYTLFRLPQDNTTPFAVFVSSPARGNAVFAPKLSLLGAQGEAIRELANDALMYRGGTLTGYFRSLPGEQYLLVASNPDAVGQNFSRTTLNRNNTTIAMGTGFVAVSNGAEHTAYFVYSHTGEIVVRVDPLTINAP